MTHKIYDKYGIQVTQFCSEFKGVCFQITIGDSYVQLDKEEYFSMISKLYKTEIK